MITNYHNADPVEIIRKTKSLRQTCMVFHNIASGKSLEKQLKKVETTQSKRVKAKTKYRQQQEENYKKMISDLRDQVQSQQKNFDSETLEEFRIRIRKLYEEDQTSFHEP